MFFSIQFWSEIWLLQLQIAMSLLYISHNAPYLPPKILHNLCFSFLLGITAVPREIENNAYATFGGASLRKRPFLLTLHRWVCFAWRNVCDSVTEIPY